MSIHDRVDKITRDADWQDGMNIFRQRVWQDIERLNEEIEKIKQLIKGEPQ